MGRVAIGVAALLSACGAVAIGDPPAPDAGTGDGASRGASGVPAEGAAPPSATAGDASRRDGAVCYGVEFSSESLAVDTYLLLDASSAMTAPAAPSRAASWWSEVGSALSDYIANPRAAYIQTALNFFPVAATLPAACGPGYEPPAVAFASLPEVGPALLAARAARVPAGPNAAGPALSEALSHVKANPRPGALPAVVLVTRGMPGECDPRDLVELARQAFETEPRARTSVIVLGASANLAAMNAVAASGGTEEAIVLPGADVGAEFGEAMRRVQSTGPCKYAIPELPSEPPLLSVYIRSEDGEKRTLDHVQNRAACGAEGGWYSSDDKAPAEFLLCPASCIEKGNGDVGLIYGCD